MKEDAVEYSALFRARYVDVLRFIERRVASPEDAAELAADVFRIAWQRFEPGEASRAWLFGIARNVVLEHYRKTGRRMAATRRYEAEFAVALALSMQLGGVTSSAQPPDPDDTTVLADPTPEADRMVLETTGPLRDALDTDPGFGGIWVDDDHAVHVVMTTDRLSAAEAAAQEAFGDEPPVPIEIDQGDKTYEELVAQRDEITELRRPLLDQGINITTWGPDEELNAVYVKVVDLTEDDEQTIHEALGDDVVVLMEDWPGNEEDAFSRTSDTSP